MGAPEACPCCEAPLALFSPRDALAHVNACLDRQQSNDETASTPCTDKPAETPQCGICNRDLGRLTEAARIEHANRCADSVLPLPPQRTVARRRRAAPNSNSTSIPTTSATATISSRNSAPSRDEPSSDPRVDHLLTMLGLQRYTKKFATEEIDLVALRLLSDDDLAALSIPEAARRRIAEAMHSVSVLAQLQSTAKEKTGVPAPKAHASAKTNEADKDQDPNTAYGGEEEEDSYIPPTQRFPESRVAARLKPSKPSVLLDADIGIDEELYMPTVRKSDKSIPNDSGSSVERSAADFPGSDEIEKEQRPEFQGPNVDETERLLTQHFPESCVKTRLSSTEPSLFDGGVISSSEELYMPTPPNTSTVQTKNHVDNAAESPSKSAGDIYNPRNQQFPKSCVATRLTSTKPSILDGGVISSSQELYIPTPPEPAKAQEKYNDDSNALPLPLHERSDDESAEASLTAAVKRSPMKNHGGDESDESEEILDLIEMEDRNGRRLSGFADDLNALPLPLPSQREQDCNEDDEAEAAEAFESRLKRKRKGRNKNKPKTKKKKVCDEDMIAAIQANSTLYSRVLMMECVEFGRFVECLRSSNVTASKRALHEFLVRQGVMFKGDPPSNPEASQQFMKTLNSDPRDPDYTCG